MDADTLRLIREEQLPNLRVSSVANLDILPKTAMAAFEQ